VKRALVLLVAAGCPITPEAVEPATPTIVAPPVELACIPPTAGTRITDAVPAGRRIRYCIGDSDACFSIDPDDPDVRSFARVARPTPVSIAARAEATPPKIEICNAADCTSLTSLVLPKLSELRAATTPDGAFAAFLFAGTTLKGFVEVWDVLQARKVSTIRYPVRAAEPCADIEMLGDTLLVKTGACNAPPTRGTLYTLAGKKIADAGGKDFVLGSTVQLEGTMWAFLDATATKLVVQEVARGNVGRAVDTSGVFLIGGGKHGSSADAAIVKLGDGRLALVVGPPALGSVATIDPRNGTVELRQAPLCK
jgi:hypothetical protein